MSKARSAAVAETGTAAGAAEVESTSGAAGTASAAGMAGAAGNMLMPADFPYKEVFRRGRPQHERFDDFGLRHPRMAPGRRAKIFLPFDALWGFGEAIALQAALSEEAVRDYVELPDGADDVLVRGVAIDYIHAQDAFPFDGCSDDVGEIFFDNLPGDGAV